MSLRVNLSTLCANHLPQLFLGSEDIEARFCGNLDKEASQAVQRQLVNPNLPRPADIFQGTMSRCEPQGHGESTLFGEV